MVIYIYIYRITSTLFVRGPIPNQRAHKIASRPPMANNMTEHPNLDPTGPASVTRPTNVNVADPAPEMAQVWFVEAKCRLSVEHVGPRLRKRGEIKNCHLYE